MFDLRACFCGGRFFFSIGLGLKKRIFELEDSIMILEWWSCTVSWSTNILFSKRNIFKRVKKNHPSGFFFFLTPSVGYAIVNERKCVVFSLIYYQLMDAE